MNDNLNQKAELPLPIVLPEVEISEKLSSETIQFFKNEYLNTHKQLNDDFNLGKLKKSKYLKLLKCAQKEYIKDVNGKNLSTLSRQHKTGTANLVKNKYAFNRYVIWRKKNEDLKDVNKQIKDLKSVIKNSNEELKSSIEYKSLIDKKRNIKASYKTNVKSAKENFINIINNTESNNFVKKLNIACGNWRAYISTGGGIINRLVFVVLIIFFLLMGLIDQATLFLIDKSSVGSLSIFTFIASILLVIYIVALIIIFFRKRQGIYDVYENKHAKTQTASNGPVGSSSEITDNWDYLEELFEEEAKELSATPALPAPNKKHHSKK